MNLTGLDIPAEDLVKMFEVDPALWKIENNLTQEYFEQFGDAMPDELIEELEALRTRLSER